MFLLMLLSIIGFLTSFVVHIILLLNIAEPPEKLCEILNIGAIALVILRVLATRKLRQGDNWFYDISIRKIPPSWLKITVWTIMGYSFTFGLINVIKFLFILVPALNGTLEMNATHGILVKKYIFGSVFLFLMGFYSFEAFLNYCYKRGVQIKRNSANNMKSIEKVRS